MNSQLASTCSLVLSNYITITYISVQIQQIMKTMIRPMVGLYSSCTSEVSFVAVVGQFIVQLLQYRR